MHGLLKYGCQPLATILPKYQLLIRAGYSSVFKHL